MNESNRFKFKLRTAALAVASCLSLSPLLAEAASLGKLTILSGLGQPLRAELDIAASKDELAGMTARLAPQDAFRQAGIEFGSSLSDLRFSIDKRGDGRAVVKVSSSRPINEPFLDFLVELNWPAGRLVREYTFLLDPPEIATRQAGRPIVDARVVETVRGGSAVESRQAAPATGRASRSVATPKVAAEPKPAPEKKEADAGGRVVQRGETLRKIATESQYQGVSLEQMLVGLFRANPDAFVGKNINRLKAGAILNVPDEAAVAAVPDAEAKKIYVAHAEDWNAYRQKLAVSAARAPAASESAGQASSGKITARVEEKAAPADQSKDQVKVARTNAAAKGSDSTVAQAAAEADRVAKDRALKEAQERLASLEKNVNELQKLLEMKNQKLAELQQPSAKPPVPVEPPKPAVEAPKPVEPPKAAEPAKPVEAAPAAEPPKTEEPAKPAEAAPPVEPPKPAEAPKPAAVPPAAEPEPEEPGLVDSLLADPLPLAGGAGILALLAGYFVARSRRSRPVAAQTTALPVHTSLGPNSVFRMTGGQSVDTTNAPPQTGEFSQTGPGTIDTDEVDPVAEADVYMAYGRDSQAEEILLEALQKDPQRVAIHVKLLEIYAGRRSLKQFETLASELYALTSGAGPEWEKAAAMGAGLDPANPLYSRPQGTSELVETAVPAVVATAAAAAAAFATPEPEAVPAPAVAIEEPESFERDTFVLPKEAESVPVEVSEEPSLPEPELDTGAMTLDFDLGDDAAAAVSEAPAEPAGPVSFPEEVAPEPELADAGDALDFDLGPAPVEEISFAPVAEAPVKPAPLNDMSLSSLDLDDVAVARELIAEDSLAEPDFSPEGTLVMPSLAEGGDMADALGTWVSGELSPVEAAEPEAPKALDGDFEFEVEPSSKAADAMPAAPADSSPLAAAEHDRQLDATIVAGNLPMDGDELDFDVKLTDSIVLGQPMATPDFDIGSINLDLSMESPAPAAAEAPAVAIEAEPEPAAPVEHDEHWEETNTKLDLARAYEEMGDLEGARELLEEVAGEGPPDLAQQARDMLVRIAG